MEPFTMNKILEPLSIQNFPVPNVIDSHDIVFGGKSNRSNTIVESLLPKLLIIV